MEDKQFEGKYYNDWKKEKDEKEKEDVAIERTTTI